MTTPTAGGYPATFTFDPPDTIARWRVIGNIVLAIPHLIIAYVLGIVAEILAFVAWILGVFTAKVPEGILGVIAMCLRYNTRTQVYASFLKEEYPPFSFATTLADPGDDPRVRVDYQSETEGRNRLTIFFRLLLAIPHFVVLVFLGLAAFVVYLIAWFAVLFTGKWPTGLRNFVIGLTRWTTRLNAYMYLLTDAYPPFSFE
ncbi:DUF4389 domain-containing protein [Aeromicrobium ginsengisoli]|uniref:DUF4389 domain-containing protein n=1 Tax=Aeromicrobium ginsengisoli TaxID=363867 RepID=A0A5M4FBB6_9ACTN|nr:DUF4389 domain-containing protein [Aeromicrobium ginsengisoli]KAA1395658.1 DUF4389 domain-containing protein [Aeromicrobium ginsengisoli]